MFKNLKFLIAFIALVANFSFALDTLEVYAFLVEFKEETKDNSLTTGTGLFNTCETKKGDYSLDPCKNRGSHSYWDRHFEFAKAYYEAASNGRQTISWRIFPEEGETAYKLDKGIIDYNRTAKRKDEKVAEYDEARSRDYMTFIYDAVTKAHSSDDSPFKPKLSANPNTKRAYMIIHAGASRLVDGGSLGTNGANTPGDFIDVYVSPDYWVYLPKDSVAKDTSKIDTLAGLPLANAAIDTLKEIMVVSETASQDGLNWGVNGIIVNQIGRSLGMPNTYDVVQGISRLGYFDVMDFAGYNAGNGFFPVLPSAWLRAYMGWVNVKTVSPKAGSKITVDVSAAGSGKGDEIIKVPLSANEYLLIENRERTVNKEGEIDVVVISDMGDSNVYTIPVDSLSTIFEDSVMVKGKLQPNKKKAKGIVLSTSSFDAALPASGIVVWKINEWYLKETLQYGISNFWGGDTLRDHQYGIGLVEADGILTVGKTFKNALGQDAFDYGSGADLLPHLRFAKDKKFDTVYSIKPSGYGNTATLQGGYTGIRVTAAIAKDARIEKTPNAFMGDSVKNFASPVIQVTIDFEDLTLPGSEFPKAVGLDVPASAAALLDYPSGSIREGEKLLVFAGVDGTLQAMSAMGDNVMDSDTSVTQKIVANKDSSAEVKLYRLGKANGALLGLAAHGESVFTLHEKTFVRTDLTASLDYVEGKQTAVKVADPVAGPMIIDSLAWILTKTSMEAYNVFGKFEKNTSVDFNLPEGYADNELNSFAKCGDGKFAVALDNANFIYVSKNASSMAMRLKKLPIAAKGLEPVKGQKFNVVCSDFDRDGENEAFVLGSRGYGAFVKLGDTLKVIDAPRQYKRGGAGDGLNYHELSASAVGDINDDGFPEAVFLGHNKVYAVDYKGIPVAGFPITISKGAPEYKFGADPLVVDLTGDEIPEIIVPANGGLLYAYKGNGKNVGGYFPMQTGTFEYGDTVKPMSVFVGDAVDSLAGLELYAFHRNNVSGFRLPKAKTAALKASWALPGNGNERTNYFDATLLKDVKITADKAELTDFYMYPNPVRGGIAKSRFTIGANAKYAELEVYGVTGLCLLKLKMDAPKKGVNQWDAIDLSKLGFNVYSVRLRVKFENGETKQKFYRIGVIQ